MPKGRKAAKLVGQLFAKKYFLESLIGEGGFGAVFSAKNIDTNEKYAIKVLFIKPNAILDQERDLQYFQREATTLSLVQHPNIVKVFEIGISDQDLPYLAMELIEGKLLSDALRSEGAFSLPRLVKIISQLSKAVEAIHNQGIIHRDLKPENIIISGEGENEIVKLLDFGLAKVFRGEKDDKWLRTLTGRGQIHGTIFYMSPEQCEGKKLDERTDIYSLGILAYELLTGQPPFRGDFPLSVMMLHLDAPPPPLRASRPDITLEIEIAILKALEKDPANRYPKALDFAITLENAAKHVEVKSMEQLALSNPNSPSITSTIALGTSKETKNMDMNLFQQELKEIQETKYKSQEEIPKSHLSELIDMFNKKNK
ncbi:MAG: serine/threonine protein kinase [Acidobacteria bacterium]|nr:serine/threonine protein kinase [Acidobacteriota bacterium]